MIAFARTRSHHLARLTTLFWIGLLLFLAVLPRLPYVPLAPNYPLTTLAHFATHLMLAGLIYLAVPRPPNLAQRVRVALAAFLFSAALGLAIEALQAFMPGRDATRSDFIFASSGALAGAGAAFVLDYLRLSPHRIANDTCQFIQRKGLIGPNIECLVYCLGHKGRLGNDGGNIGDIAEGACLLTISEKC